MKKVLIIDDEEDICLLLERQLTRISFDVRYENNLNQGLKAITEFKPSVIILDNNLPDGMGIDKLAYIRQTYPEVKIVMISAYTSLTSKAVEKGAHAFIPKPFNFAAIAEHIQ
jgi:DNA-binding NtrC family response regulator